MREEPRLHRPTMYYQETCIHRYCDLNFSHMNLMSLYQSKFQDIQEFRDQYMAVCKVCDELDLKFGRCVDDVRAVCKEKGNSEPTSTQKRQLTKSKKSITQYYSYTKLTNRYRNSLNKWKTTCYRERTHSN